MKIPIIGLPHHGYEKIRQTLGRGNTVFLIREPTNEKDPNAIRAEFRMVTQTENGQRREIRTKIGYVPAKMTGRVGDLMNERATIQALIEQDELPKDADILKIEIIPHDSDHAFDDASKPVPQRRRRIIGAWI
jgi:hypothetical protein